MARTHLKRVFAATALLGLLAIHAGAAEASGSLSLASRETAVAPEVNPPGDIPDDQVFVAYRSPTAGFSIEVPEGWSRTERPNGATFADKYGSLDIAVEQRSIAPTPESVKKTEIPQILGAGHAAEIGRTTRLSVFGGKVIAVDYLSNSDSNPVTNRRIRLENRRLYYFADGRQAVVTLSAPAGADNVDQWKLIAESFRWVK